MSSGNWSLFLYFHSLNGKLFRILKVTLASWLMLVNNLKLHLARFFRHNYQVRPESIGRFEPPVTVIMLSPGVTGASRHLGFASESSLRSSMVSIGSQHIVIDWLAHVWYQVFLNHQSQWSYCRSSRFLQYWIQTYFLFFILFYFLLSD